MNREVNNGRGPVDFSVSYGSADKTVVEMKLAKNAALRKNLEHQVKIYEKASDADQHYTVILYFTYDERRKVKLILTELNLLKNPFIVLIDARRDNKQSAPKATEF